MDISEFENRLINNDISDSEILEYFYSVGNNKDKFFHSLRLVKQYDSLKTLSKDMISHDYNKLTLNTHIITLFHTENNIYDYLIDYQNNCNEFEFITNIIVENKYVNLEKINHLDIYTLIRLYDHDEKVLETLTKKIISSFKYKGYILDFIKKYDIYIDIYCEYKSSMDNYYASCNIYKLHRDILIYEYKTHGMKRIKQHNNNVKRIIVLFMIHGCNYYKIKNKIHSFKNMIDYCRLLNDMRYNNIIPQFLNYMLKKRNFHHQHSIIGIPKFYDGEANIVLIKMYNGEKNIPTDFSWHKDLHNFLDRSFHDIINKYYGNILDHKTAKEILTTDLIFKYNPDNHIVYMNAYDSLEDKSILDRYPEYDNMYRKIFGSIKTKKSAYK